MTTNFDDLYSTGNSTYIKASAMTEPIPAKITGMDVKEFDSGNKLSLNLETAQGDKEFALNKTQYNSMKTYFGNSPAAWLGKGILLVKGTTTYQGRTVPTVIISPYQLPHNWEETISPF